MPEESSCPEKLIDRLAVWTDTHMRKAKDETCFATKTNCQNRRLWRVFGCVIPLTRLAPLRAPGYSAAAEYA